jgi:mannose-6-phosphate isomerase-like protein (cupin superfamily)
MSISSFVWNLSDTAWKGEFQGTEHGSDVSIIFTHLDNPGTGPSLHSHPYTETFIVQKGTVIFSDGSNSFEASAGEIVVIPPGTPHRFTGKSNPVEMIDIHASETFITRWLSQDRYSTRQVPLMSACPVQCNDATRSDDNEHAVHECRHSGQSGTTVSKLSAIASSKNL